MSFRPNRTALLQTRTGTNMHAEPIYAAGVTVRIAVVHLNKSVAKTSVRTDSSASRANASEVISTSKVLFALDRLPKPGDLLEVAGFRLVITGIEHRFAVDGRLDHYECDLVIANDGALS